MEPTLARAGGICLRSLLSKAQFLGGDIRISSCSSDSRRCRPGDLFVALVGSQHDGHEFAGQAVERGAVAVLAERPLPLSVPTCIVEDTRVAYGQVCQALAGDPSQQLRVVGVSGTYGKTTTALLTAAILEAAGAQVGIMGSLGFCDAIESSAGNTAPAPPELADWLARMAINGCSHAVIETSSQGLAQRRMAGVELDAAVITNVRRSGRNGHGSFLNYRTAKGRLFDQLRPEGVAIVNADDAASCHFLDQLDCPVLSVAVNAPAELTARVIERHRSEQTLLMTAGSDTIPIRTHLVGDHQLYNLLCAAAVGLAAGIDLPTVARGLESLRSIPGRMERIECGQPFGAFVDTARTPDALCTALRALRPVTRGRLMCVFGAPGEKDQAIRPLLGRAAERHADLVILTSDNPVTEKPLQIAHDILDGCTRPGAVHVLPQRAKAIQWALAEAAPDDTVLIAGKGSDRGQRIGDRIHPFDDREVARYCLYQMAAQKAHESQ